MTQKQPAQNHRLEPQSGDTHPSTADHNRQSNPMNQDNPIAYDEAPAGQEPDGGESLLSGAPREGEAEMVDKASKKKRYPQVEQ